MTGEKISTKKLELFFLSPHLLSFILLFFLRVSYSVAQLFLDNSSEIGCQVLRGAATRNQQTTSRVTHSCLNQQRLRDLLDTRDPLLLPLPSVTRRLALPVLLLAGRLA